MPSESLESFAEKAAKGDKVSGSIKSITDFGVIGLDGGIDGLIHLSDILDEAGEEAVRRYKKGEEVKQLSCQSTLSVSASAGHQADGTGSGTGLMTSHDKGDVVKGKVVSVDAWCRSRSHPGAYLRVSESAKIALKMPALCWWVTKSKRFD